MCKITLIRINLNKISPLFVIDLNRVNFGLSKINLNKIKVHMRSNFSVMLVTIVTALIFTSCNDSEESGYDIPNAYNFENVDYSGQSTRIAMLTELVNYAKTANAGAVLDASKLQAMYENSGSPFNSEALNTASKDLKSKTFELDQPLIESFIVKLAQDSQSAGAIGANGRAGVVSSNDGSKTYLFDEKGYEYIQLVEKGLMGACFYYQIMGVYLTEEKIGEAVDNIEVTPGLGTNMEHHWDEAFGYISLPTNFPNQDQELLFWGKYIQGREENLSSGSKLMSAFITGRAAISAKDMDTKNEMVDIIYTELELMAGATAIHYINSALNNYTDDALRNHALSEAWVFSNNLQYNPKKVISTQEVLEARTLLGENFYEVSRADLIAARTILASTLGLSSVSEQL
jgi:hypothetical protein